MTNSSLPPASICACVSTGPASGLPRLAAEVVEISVVMAGLVVVLIVLAVKVPVEPANVSLRTIALVPGGVHLRAIAK